MDNAEKNLAGTMTMLLGNFFVQLKNVLTVGLCHPFKQALKDSIVFFGRLENIQRLDERKPKNVLSKQSSGTGKNLLACIASGNTQMLFFNISVFELIDLYIGVAVVRIRRFIKRDWIDNRILAELEKKGRVLSSLDLIHKGDVAFHNAEYTLTGQMPIIAGDISALDFLPQWTEEEDLKDQIAMLLGEHVADEIGWQTGDKPKSGGY